MFLSIIIPACNEYPILKKFLEMYATTIQKNDIEVIIVLSSENGDETKTISTAKIIEATVHNRGKQMNIGAKIARGQILMFLHADVLPPPSFFTDIELSIKNGYEFGFFAYNFHPTSFGLKFNASFTGRDGFFAGGGDQIHFMTQALFNKMGGYNEKLDIMEDFDFVKRIRKKRLPYTIVKNRATVSSRKYVHRSWLKVNFANLIAFLMFKMDMDSLKIKNVYQRILG